MADEKRKTFATTIYPSISKKFKIYCMTNDQAMNEVLEKLMEMYSNGEIKLNEK